MKLVISKKFPRGTRAVIRSAIETSNAHASFNASTIYVRYVDGIAHAGSASQYEDKAILQICPDDSDFLDTIFHECYHLHQYSKGILKQRENGFVYRGIYIPLWLYNLFYAIIPFELSAKAFAHKMCQQLEAI